MQPHLVAAAAPLALSTQGLVNYLQGLFGPLFLGIVGIVAILMMSSATPSASNGVLPVTSSKSTMPIDQMSARASTPLDDWSCSGTAERFFIAAGR